MNFRTALRAAYRIDNVFARSRARTFEAMIRWAVQWRDEGKRHPMRACALAAVSELRSLQRMLAQIERTPRVH